ncbi:hypothetical protein CVO_09395 [Sulfurimonas sp. CVO]|uniref:CZB domain-containing protein n=1 Tax=Sulfurimonas sp. CVO TaxID=2283483 RepID=UPI00132EB874|nr:CZB domain-containing protein [Sulfurimonas sp. CVO]QHG92021.1 hypothetical protein CVO_09395 [Sulfurimonas sp. CVO]
MNRLVNFTQGLNSLIQSAQNTQRSNKKVSTDMFINLAKLDHVVFKLKGYDAAFKDNHSFVFQNHTSCRFGKWYLDEVKELFGKAASYKKVDAMHKSIHDNVRVVPNYIEKERL